MDSWPENAPGEWISLEPRCTDIGASYLVFYIDGQETRDMEVEVTLIDRRYDD